jgi:hypothetical protein
MFAHVGGVPVEESPDRFFRPSDGFPAFAGSLFIKRQFCRRTTGKAEAR